MRRRSHRVLLQGPLGLRLMFAGYFGCFGVLGGIAGMFHSNNVLKWLGSSGLLLAGVVAAIRILVAGFIVNADGIRVRAIWRTWTVPWRDVFRVDIGRRATMSLFSNALGCIELTTTTGLRLWTQGLTRNTPASPKLVHDLAVINDARRQYQLTSRSNSELLWPELVPGAQAKFTACWFPGSAPPRPDDIFAGITLRLSKGFATLQLAIGYTEDIDFNSFHGVTRHDMSTTFQVQTLSGAIGWLQLAENDALLLARTLTWPMSSTDTPGDSNANCA